MIRKFDGGTLVLATHNQGKIQELQGVLSPLCQNLVTAAALNLSEPDETGVTFLENATLKAQYVAQRSGWPALSDDSGLCISALEGQPGVYSADWAGIPRDFNQAMNRVLTAMQGVSDRTAYFQTVMVLAWPDGHFEWVEGRVDGVITGEPQGTNGFGYDPIFKPQGWDKTFGQSTKLEKQSRSHRGSALAALIEKYFS